MVDRVYKAALPRLRADLEKLREEFSSLGSTKTNWTELRIEPLLRHLDSLEHLLHSDEHSREFSRLRKGVALFHSDLVYLRENVKGLERVLQSEEKSLKKLENQSPIRGPRDRSLS
jgi:molecular chaperone GrpE (heat shock protein)